MRTLLRRTVSANPRLPRSGARRVRVLRPIRPSSAAELSYRAGLQGLVKAVQKAVAEVVLPAIRPSWPDVSDDIPSTLQAAIRRALLRVGNIGKQAERLASLAVDRSRESVDDRLVREIRASVGVDITNLFRDRGPLKTAMDKARRANVDLIKTIPEEHLDRLGKTIQQAWVEGARWETLAEKVEHVNGVTETRAKLIARDQIAKMNGAFNRVRQTSVGIERYRWSTSKDERVRESHAEVNGQEFAWNEPGPVAGSIDGEPCHPGEDVQCRCLASPVFDLDAAEAKMEAEIAAEGEELQ